MTPQFLWLVNGLPSLAWIASASAQAAVLIVALLVLRAAFGRHLTPGWRSALWLIVLLRLTVPAAVESRWSLVGVAKRAASIATREDVAIATAKPQAADRTHVSVTYGPIPNAPREIAVMHATPDVVARVTPVDLAIGGWITGVALLAVWQATGAIRLRRAIHRMRQVDDAAILALAVRCAREIGVRQRVRLVETDHLRAPAVCGILRPTILLPVGVADALSPAELRLVLLHEFAHVRRADALFGAIARLVRAFHCFNPLVWLGVAAFRADRELACDAAVLRVVGDGNRRAYGECLLHVVERLSGLPPHPATLGVFGSSRILRKRIDMIAAPPSRSLRARGVRTAIGTLVLLGISAAAAVGEPKAMTTQTAATQLSDEDAAVQAILDKPIDLPPLGQMTLRDATAAIEKASGVPIHVEWAKLETAGISSKKMVRPSLHNVTLARAIVVAFADHLHQSPFPFDFDVVDGAIVVSTPNDAAAFRLRTRAFLLTGRMAGRGDQNLKQNFLVQIDSQTWKENGGIGEIEVRPDQLIVTQLARLMPEVSRQVQRLISPPPIVETPRPIHPDVTQTTMVLETDFRGVPLEDAIDFFRDETGVSIFANWQAIEAAGVRRTTPVTLHQTNGSLARAMTALLDTAGGKTARLGFVVDDDGTLSISTQADVDGWSFCTRLYDIRDLLADARKVVPGIEGPTEAQRDAAQARWLADLTARITETIDRDSWKANGGAGDLQVLSGQLIVTQFDHVHAQVEAMLERLRTTRNLRPAVATRLILIDADRLPPALAKRSAGTTQPIELDAEQAAAIAALPSVSGTITSPRVMLLSGQRATIDVVLPRDATTTRPGAMTLDPEFECGVLATVAADRKTVTLDVTARFAGARNMTIPLTLDTTITTPDRGTTLLRLGGAIGDAPGRQVVLLVTPTVIDAGEVTPR